MGNAARLSFSEVDNFRTNVGTDSIRIDNETNSAKTSIRMVDDDNPEEIKNKKNITILDKTNNTRILVSYQSIILLFLRLII